MDFLSSSISLLEEDPWKITTNVGCNCSDCEPVKKFLLDPSQKQYELKETGQMRSHVAYTFSSVQDLRVTTIQEGASYSLQIEKRIDPRFIEGLQKARIEYAQKLEELNKRFKKQ
jgi:hypothetical protein